MTFFKEPVGRRLTIRSRCASGGGDRRSAPSLSRGGASRRGPAGGRRRAGRDRRTRGRDLDERPDVGRQTLMTDDSRWRSPSTRSSAWRRTSPATGPRVRPERDVDHPRLVLEGQEHGALRRHRVLAGHDEATDPDRPRPQLGERRVGAAPSRSSTAAVQRHHLAPSVEPDDRVGVAEPLRLRQARQRRRVGRWQAEIHRPAGDSSRHRAAHGAGDLAELPQELAPRPAERISAPIRISRSRVSSGKPVRSTTSASEA